MAILDWNSCTQTAKVCFSSAFLWSTLEIFNDLGAECRRKFILNFNILNEQRLICPDSDTAEWYSLDARAQVHQQESNHRLSSFQIIWEVISISIKCSDVNPDPDSKDSVVLLLKYFLWVCTKFRVPFPLPTPGLSSLQVLLKIFLVSVHKF